MHAPATKTLALAQSVEEVFAAVVKAVETGKFTMTAVDPGNFKAAFGSGVTGFSWGNEYLATVTPEPKGALLEVVCGGLDGAPKALMDKWKNGKKADKALAAIQANLG